MQKRKGSSRFESRNSHRERKDHRAGQPFPPPCEDTKSPSSTSITLPEGMSKTIPGPSASPEMVSHRESSPNLAAVPWARLGQVTTQGSSQDREREGASRPRVLSSPCLGQQVQLPSRMEWVPLLLTNLFFRAVHSWVQELRVRTRETGRREGDEGRPKSREALLRRAHRQPLGCSCGLMRAPGRWRSAPETRGQRGRGGSGVVFPL